jgi:hypothetical protein
LAALSSARAAGAAVSRSTIGRSTNSRVSNATKASNAVCPMRIRSDFSIGRPSSVAFGASTGSSSAVKRRLTTSTLSPRFSS